VAGRPHEVKLTARPNLLWFVAPVTVAAGLGLAEQQSDRVINPLSGNPAAVEAGRRAYDQTCQSCHGPAGQGETGRGPALNTGSFAHGGEDADLFHTIRTGVPGSTMPAFARGTDEGVWELVAYLRSLSPAVAHAPVDAPAAVGNRAAGEVIFFGKAGCASCHEVNGRGGVVGPDLSAAGRAPAAAVRQKILDPNRPAPAAPAAGRAGGGRSGGRGGALQPATVVVKTQDGREIRGVRRNEDTFSLQMMDASGELHLLDKLKLSDIRVEDASLMPGDYAARLTPGEIDDVVAYLSTQQQRDASPTRAALPPGGVGHDRLVKASLEPQNWFMYWGDYQATHYSGLKQIDPGNVRQLQAIWTLPISGDSLSETTPIVVDGVMYATGSGNPATVAALDARTGRPIWSWTRQQQVRNPYEINRFNRGVAVLGHRVFVGTLDAALIALDARTGRPLWEVQVADTTEGYSITSPPLALKDKVIVGISGGEFATRGFIDAYDAATGKRVWRFHTVPGPGEFGHDTWKGDSWERGGAAPWLTGSYDPELNLLYWAAGNPAPHTDRTTRGEGDNLFSCSVLALDADTGQRKWHYQFTPNDGHDWDAAEDMILVDRVWHGQNRKLLLHADRAEGSILVYPTLGGGTNFQAPSYSPVTGLLYLEYAEAGAQFTSSTAEYQRGRPYTGQGRGAAPGRGRGPADPSPSAGIKAIDPENGKTVWDFKIFQGSLTSGVLATAGGVLFGAIRDGNIAALDARSGKPLWHFQTGGTIAASPMSYAVGGRQFVAIAAGNTLYAFALPEARP
jgi:outer membrane protein assembly factor BamB/mono/diheme cytochrome c family protein